jgi:hypothetical protein
MRFKKVVLAAFAVLVCLGVNFTGAAAANAAQVPPAIPHERQGSGVSISSDNLAPGSRADEVTIDFC